MKKVLFHPEILARDTFPGDYGPGSAGKFYIPLFQSLTQRLRINLLKKISLELSGRSPADRSTICETY